MTREGAATPNVSLYDEAVQLLVAIQQYAEGKYENGLVWHDALKPWLDDFLIRSALDEPDPAPSSSDVLRAALERLTDAASVEEEDWTPQTHDELVAALNQAGRVLFMETEHEAATQKDDPA